MAGVMRCHTQRPGNAVLPHRGQKTCAFQADASVFTRWKTACDRSKAYLWGSTLIAACEGRSCAPTARGISAKATLFIGANLR
jgi:hypothetical protein